MTGALSSPAAWAFVLQVARVGGNAVVFLMAARLLPLEQIGVFALAYAPVRWAQALHKAGVVDSTVAARPVSVATDGGHFWLAMIVSALTVAGQGVAAIVLWALGNGPLAAMLLALCVVPVANGAACVPEAMMQRGLRFRALALRTVVAQFLAGGLAITLAWVGAGGWALIGFVITSAVTNAMICLGLTRYRTTPWPGRQALRSHTPQFVAISARALLAGAALPALQLAIGAAFGLGAAGGFQVAQRVFRMTDALAIAPARALGLPVFARLGDPLNPDAILRAARLVSVLSAPAFALAIWLADPALRMMAGDATARASVDLTRILCLLAVHTAALAVLTPVLTAAGMARLPLRRVIHALIGTSVFSVFAWHVSAEAMLLGHVVASYGALAMLLVYLARHHGFPAGRFVMAICLPYTLAALAICTLAFWEADWAGVLTLFAYPVVLALVMPGLVSVGRTPRRAR